jgi:hypothetical protein
MSGALNDSVGYPMWAMSRVLPLIMESSWRVMGGEVRLFAAPAEM